MITYLNAGVATEHQHQLIAAAADARRSRTDSKVQVRDLHPGDVVRQYDWPLHVREVTLSQAAVTIAVTEFEFALHYPADAQVRLIA
jgi:hypothetical protein